jgi:hypothetical protein
VRWVGGKFRDYWKTHGGLAQQGYPISDEFTEVSDLNGKPYVVQYFERAVFEKHPENSPPFDVLLSQLGTFQFKRKYPGGDPSGGGAPPPPPPVPATQPAGGPDIRSQTIEFTGRNSARFRAAVTEVKEAQEIPPSHAYDGGKARGKFVIVYATVTNLGTNSAPTGSDGFRLRDGAGRNFDILSDLDYFDIIYAAFDACGCPDYLDNLQPGVPNPMVFIFDVPVDAANYYLVVR